MTANDNPTTAGLSKPAIHELKVAGCPYFDRILDGTKTFEVRRDDRGFRVGDTLWLREWNGSYTGRSIHKRVSYIFGWDQEDLGLNMLAEGVVVMGLSAVQSDVRYGWEDDRRG
jgi:hypothetical protein